MAEAYVDEAAQRISDRLGYRNIPWLAFSYVAVVV